MRLTYQCHALEPSAERPGTPGGMAAFDPAAVLGGAAAWKKQAARDYATLFRALEMTAGGSMAPFELAAGDPNGARIAHQHHIDALCGDRPVIADFEVVLATMSDRFTWLAALCGNIAGRFASTTRPTPAGSVAAVSFAAKIDPDAALVALCREFDALEQQIATIRATPGAAAEDEARQDAMAEPLTAQQENLLGPLCVARAVGLDGLKARANTIVRYAPDLAKDDPGGYIDGRLIAALLRDLTTGHGMTDPGRSANALPASDAALIAICDRMVAIGIEEDGLTEADPWAPDEIGQLGDNYRALRNEWIALAGYLVSAAAPATFDGVRAAARLAYSIAPRDAEGQIFADDAVDWITLTAIAWAAGRPASVKLPATWPPAGLSPAVAKISATVTPAG